MKIGIIGCGNMGSALVSGFISSGKIKCNDIFVSDKIKSQVDKITKEYKINSVDNLTLAEKCDIIILCVKPKDAESMLSEIKPGITTDKTIVSIMAGITTDYIKSKLGKDVPVVRCMPNLPVVIGEGMCVLYCDNVSNERFLFVKKLFECVGKTIEVDNEYLMDTATAVSGSGPAYLFYFVESIIEAAKELNFPISLINNIVYQTIFGAVRLLLNSKASPQELRQMVTSPGGTTEAAISYLEKNNFKDLIKTAIKLAKKRAEELKK